MYLIANRRDSATPHHLREIQKPKRWKSLTAEASQASTKAALIIDQPEDSLAQSVALPHGLSSIDNAIDQLTMDLAVFWIDQLERSVTFITEDHEMKDTDDLEDEL